MSLKHEAVYLPPLPLNPNLNMLHACWAVTQPRRPARMADAAGPGGALHSVGGHSAVSNP